MNIIPPIHDIFGGRITRHTLFIVIGFLLCGYFSYHLVHGNRSLIRYVQLNEQIKVEAHVLGSAQFDRKAIETKVSMMRPGSVDTDLLEERVHRVLGYVGSNDYIIQSSKNEMP